MGLLDVLFPKYCVSCKTIGSYLCDRCFTYLSFDVIDICLVCNKPSLDGRTHPVCIGKYTIDGSFASIVYEGIAKKLIYTFKYKPYVTALQNILIDLFYEGIIQKEAVSTIFSQTPPERIVFVPIPLHASKLRQRGYNHASILANGLGKRFGMQTKELLQRVKKTVSQKELLSKDRKENVKGAFALTTLNKEAKNASIFLIDDIVTSGATLQEAANVLKHAGYTQVYGLALARGR